MAIRYTPQPLKGKNRLFWIWGLVLALASFGLMFGAMLSARWIGTASAVTLTIVIFISAIVIHNRIKRRLASSLESTKCPQCGLRRMHFREEFRDHPHAYLVCPDCGTKWDIGQI
jgi:predicted RNA-binding Zn-ribbon protein involved in translation (DUF1610 family)